MGEHREADSSQYTVEGAKSAPLVSCVMVTGKDAGHYAMARLAAESFEAQTYPNKELVIINDGPETLNLNVSRCREIRIDQPLDPTKRLTLGALRNIGLDESRGDWICQWDDDDWSHPHRISMQMAVRQEGCCVMLQHQIRYSSVANTAYKLDCIVGHAGTIIHPKEIKHRYPEQRLSEDAVFWVENWGDNRVVLGNDSTWYPGPALYLRFFHGSNSWDEKHVMREYADPTHAGKWHLNKNERYYLAEVLRNYGIEAKDET